jgi:hypothetical protein
MDEVWLRVLLVSTVFLVAAGIAMFRRRRPPVRTIRSLDLAGGVYLFTSDGCETCATARAKLEESLGHGKFSEVTWEREPEHFEALGIEAVPAVLVVDESGNGRLYPGQPPRTLRTP